ncbi:hypothetical protein Tco_0222550 [Tanacetum coccineum]
MSCLPQDEDDENMTHMSKNIEHANKSVQQKEQAGSSQTVGGVNTSIVGSLGHGRDDVGAVGDYPEKERGGVPVTAAWSKYDCNDLESGERILYDALRVLNSALYSWSTYAIENLCFRAPRTEWECDSAGDIERAG